MKMPAVMLTLLLAGCGVKLATVKDAQDRDLMLLGHDPVAYFTVGGCLMPASATARRRSAMVRAAVAS